MDLGAITHRIRWGVWTSHLETGKIWRTPPARSSAVALECSLFTAEAEVVKTTAWSGSRRTPKRLCVILGHRDSCRIVSGVSVPPMSVPSGQIEPYFGHELLHSRAPVVSCDVVVQVLPDSFDAVVVRAIRWQEVQPYLARSRRLQCQLDLQAVVDAVVVENEMDPTCIPVRLGHEFVEELQKQEAVLPVPFDPCELAGFGIESTAR